MGFRSLHENWVLYQGTTLVGPKMIENMSGFSPCLSCPAPNFSAASLAPEGIFLPAHKRIQRIEKRTSAAKAGLWLCHLRYG
jgi:hypothetical protein